MNNAMNDGLVKVLLADDHAMVREGLAAVLGRDPQIQVVGQCGEGLKVVEETQRLEPNVVILDISMPGLNGLDVCRELHRKHRKLAILILTMYDSEEFIASALENGASGYLLKDSAAEQLTEAVHRVARGEKFLGPGISSPATSGGDRVSGDSYQLLTPRERQVFQLIAEGCTSREVAERLGLSIKTAETHRTRLMRKLGIHDQTSLVKFALRKGIIPLK